MNNFLKLNVWKLENVFKKLPMEYKEVIGSRKIYCQDQYGNLDEAYLSQDDEGKLVIKPITEIS